MGLDVSAIATFLTIVTGATAVIISTQRQSARVEALIKSNEADARARADQLVDAAKTTIGEASIVAQGAVVQASIVAQRSLDQATLLAAESSKQAAQVAATAVAIAGETAAQTARKEIADAQASVAGVVQSHIEQDTRRFDEVHERITEVEATIPRTVVAELHPKPEKHAAQSVTIPATLDE
jgi:hypothetical protein